MKQLLLKSKKSNLPFSLTEKKQAKKSSFSITTNMLKCLFVVLSLTPFAEVSAQFNYLDMAGNYQVPTSGYSLRRLSSTYNGSAVQVRRTGDNALKDIGFVYSSYWGLTRDLDTASLLAFTDAGNVWDAGVSISGANLYYNKQLSNGDLLVASYNTNRIHRSTDNGLTWDAGVLVASGAGIRGITQLANGNLVATGYLDNKVYRSTDNGASWDAGTLIAAGAGLSGITQLSNGHVLALGTLTNIVYRSTDNGATWNAGVLVAAGAGLSGITQLSNGTILVTGNTSNKIYRSTDNGATWDAGTTIAGASLNGVTQLASGHVVAVDNTANKIYRSTNNGSTWDAGSLVATGAGIIGISQLANGDVIASATNGRIYKSTKLSAFVRIWYDQSGRNLQATQASVFLQPRIVNAGVIETSNGKPAVYFAGSDFLLCNSPTPFPTTGFSGFTANIVAKWTTVGTSLSSSQTLIDNNYNGTQGFVIRDRPDLPSKPASFGITVSPGTLSTVSDNTQTGNGTTRILSFGANNTTVSGFKEGAAMATSAISGTNYALQNTFGIGASYNNGAISNYLTGHISEIIILSVAPDCNFNYTELDQGDYYNTTVTSATSVTLGPPSPPVTVCVNTPIVPITFATTGITGIDITVWGATNPFLPPGVTASYSNNLVTVSGTPTQVGVFNCYVPLTLANPNACSGTYTLYFGGTITVVTNSVSAASAVPTVCTNSVLSAITHTTTGATGIGSPTNLPPGVSAAFSNNTITISGTPTAAGTFNYTIPLTGGCGAVNATGTITVTNTGTINTASVASSTPTLCVGSVLTPITHTTTGATGIGTATGLPAGVSASWANNVVTISGTPTASGTFTYSIPLIGGCGAVNATGTINVNSSGAANTAGAASSSPTICAGQVLPNITHTTTGATGIGTATGLPAGLNATWAGNVITISGTPVGYGTFNYAIPLSGGCGTVSATGTITINATQPYISSSLPITAVGTVSTLAGNSFGNIDGTGTAARFRNPTSAVADALGNLYVADQSNANIRKITPAGVVTTFAGTNSATPVRGLVNATGTAARFSYPYAIAMDRFGNLFVSDLENNVIRKITADGVVTTYAGTGAVGNTNGPAVSATFNYPTGLATDAAGNLYVADQGNYVIRKITPAGIVSNFAGSGALGNDDGLGATASFYYIDQMCSDAAGNLYVYDAYVIRKITPTGMVSTIAGTGNWGNTNGFASLASFGWMQGIAVDAAGNIYVSDTDNSTIRRITPAGIVSTLAGSTYGFANGVGATARFRGPMGLATDPSGNLFVTEQRTIRKIEIAETVGACIGDAVVFTGNGGTGYTWSGPQAITNGVSFTISAAGMHTVTVSNSSCSPVTRAITVNVNQPTVTAASNPSVCVSTILPTITRTTTVATGIGAATGLPTGVTATWAANVLTISGIPTDIGTFNYSIPLLGGCPFNATGTITVNDNTVSVASSSPTLCINTPLTPITHTTTGATGISIILGLPAGVTAAWASNTITISGTPTQMGTFNYSIRLAGGCGIDYATGTIRVTSNSVTNTAGSAASSPTVCINTPITNITFATTLATGIGAPTGLPTGVTANWASNVITISGTPTVSGSFPYSIPLTGGCGVVNATGTITVNSNVASLSLGSAPAISVGTTTVNLPYSNATGIINYNITWSAAASAVGFVNVTNASFPVGSIPIAVPASGPVSGAFYSGTFTIVTTCTGIVTNYPFNIFITGSNVLNNAGLTAATPSSVAFSMRLLSSTYTGPAVQIRRSSDGELRDVYFDGTGIVSLTSQVSLAGGGPATATTLTSWIGANSGTVAIWYDQSGQWKNASNATAASQPRIINAGVIDLVNGKPSLFTDGVDDSLTFSNSVTNNFSIFILGSTTNTHEIDVEANSGTSGMGGQRYILGATQSGNDGGQGLSVGTNGISNYEHGNSYMPPTAVYSGAVTGLNLVDVIYSNRTPSIYQNATLVRTGITSPKTLVYASTQIGAGSYGAFNGNIPECIIFPNVLSDANRQILECNQISFYSVSVAAPSLTLGQTTRIPLGTTSSSLPFTSPNSITNYSITWNASAISAGFVNVTNASFPFSQISIAVPAVGPVAGSFYSGTLTVTYNCNGASTNYPFRVYITNSNVLNNAGLTAATPSSVAFSMRLLSSTYTGPAVQIRRSSDGELRDVYFDGTGIVSLTSQVSLAGGGAATATTLSSWIGANSGTVAIWYDQSGQWKNASNATAASQPRIINAGVIDLVNGKPSLFTDGVDDSLTFSNSVTNNFSIFILGSTTATQEIDPESNSSTSGTSGQKYILGAIQNGGGLPVNSGQGLSLGTNGISNYELADGYMPPTAVYSGAVTGLNLVDVIYSNRTPSIYQNATLVRTGITSPKTLVYASTQIGAGPPYGAFNGNIPECIIFPNVLSDANRQILECNQSAYYSIALATVTSPSINPTVCIGSAIPNITHTTVGTTGIGATTGLPAGVSAAWASNTITISGTPMASGTFNYSIPLTGGCGVVNATGTITVNGLTNASCGAFITRWNLATAGSGATQLSIGTATSGTVNYYWQQVTGGTATGSGSFSGSTLTITGLPTGATIRLGIYPTNFQRININNGADRSRLLDVEQWGSTVWTSMEQAFRDCNNLNITASDIPVLTSCTSMHQMFQRCATLNGPTNINSWNTSAVTNMVEMFEQATLFNQNIGSWNTAAVTNMAEMFRVAIAFNQNIGSWNTGAVTNMTRMFSEAAAFNQNIGSWNTGAVTNMSSMFQQASSFNQNIGSWNTSAVTTMNSMFQNATVFNQNIGSWTTSAVTTMNSMFTSAITFNNGGSSTINNWNTGVVTDMSFMFFQATAFNQNIGNWNTGAVTNMRQMFYLASAFNQNIGSWNTAAVTNMSDMFLNATAFNQNLGNWTLNATVNLSNMLNNSGMDCSNYSATLVGWNSNPSCPTGRTLGATGRTYGPQATAARANLVGAKGWTITGDTPFAVGAASSTQTLCINTVLTNITHTTSGATGIGVATGLPSGVTASWAANVITIIGTPTASGTFNYSIPLTGGCGAVNATGIITVTPANTAGVASSTPTVNINTALTTITHTTSGATGIGAATGLPTGVTATWASNTITISGTPTVVGIFNYSIPLTGGCGAVNATGTITVTRDTDGDGVGDTADGDDDNDGIIDTLECCIDSDGDGVTDTLDIDDDNDGIPDIEEAGFKAYSNGKSTMDRSSAATWVDANANGINDFIDAMITAGTYLLPDTDGDGVPNYRDLDSDNDALFDIDEANIFNGDGDSNGDCDSNGDGNGDGLDGDGDGLLNLYDNSASYGTTARAYAQDADVNGTPDYMQLDSNSDGVKDIAETLYSALDINNDGKIDGTVDIDNDGLLDAFDTNTAVKGSPRDLNRKLYLDFDGRNDYGQDATALGVLANETIMAWVDLNSAFSAAGVIAGQPGFQLRINSSRNLQAVVNGSTITYSTPVAPFATAVLNTSQWYHVGAVYDGSTVKLYLNGVMVASGAASGNIASAALTLGKNPSAASNYFKGKIDEVRIFDVALTDLQFQRMVYQEVQNTGSQVRGSIVPKDIQSLPYANLLRNYRMDAYKDDIVDDVTTASIDSGTGMKIYNHKIIKAQEAPIPFVTRTTGTFATAIDDSSKDIRGLDVMDFDYSIIQVKHNITETANSTDLAMLVDSGVTVNMTNDTKIQNDWYLKLDGKIDLVGKSQLIQTADSELDATSTGSIERDQQGQSNMFNYNYWSSPVSTINSTTINHGFTVNGVMRDGTNASSPQNLQWTTGINSTATSPITLSSYWIFKFQNSSNTYANWSSVGQNGTLLAGQGFTMKGSSAATANQNYAFIGKPNNGTITSTVGANNLNLCGNPFPSAIDANQFIDDNITSITGTLYIWEHYSSNTSHNTIEYQGGYATYTKTGGTAPVAPSGVSGIGSSSKTPKRFIPVSQGFFVTGSATGGTITFNNGQRLFVKEDDATSYTMFKGTNPTVRADSNPEMNNAQDSYIEEQFMKLRLGFNSTNNYHRQTLLGFMNQYATAGYDNGYDGISIETLTNDMYFINGAKKLNINGDGFFNVNNVYPIGVKNATSGNVTFVVDGKENFSDSQEIYIHDNVTNTYNSIKSQPYQVNLPAGTYDTRFTLRFTNGSSLGTTDNEENHGIAVIHSQSNNMITIKNVLQEVTVKSVSLFNLLGQQVTNWKIDNQNQADIQLKVSDVSAGTYIVKVFTDGGEITKKILVKK